MNKSKKSLKPLKKPSASKTSTVDDRESKVVVEGRKLRVEKVDKETQTMADLLAGYSWTGFKKGQTVIGTISSISGKEVFLDFGGKMEGVVGSKEWEAVRDFVAKLKVGDKVSAVVISPENDKGQMIVSIRQAGSKFRWERAAQLLKNGEEVAVRVVEINKGGLVAEFEGIRGFIPGSQLSLDHQAEINRLPSRLLAVRVIEADRAQNRLIFSERGKEGAQDLAKKLADIKTKVKIGKIYDGRVAAVVSYGLFVNLDSDNLNCEGLVHISEISWAKVDNLADLYKIGDQIKVMVLGINEADGKLNLSVKQLLPDPWLDLAKKYAVDQEVKGKVTKVSSYGAFVQLEEGLEGLIHISKIPAGTEYKPGDKVACTIESVDSVAHRISLIPVLKVKPIGYK